MKFHPVSELFPLMSEPELKSLAVDIQTNGLLTPIWLHPDDGCVIDGRNRYKACRLVGVEPRVRNWDGRGSLVSFVWAMNAERRHLSAGQKAAIAVDMLPMLEAEARKRQATSTGGKTPQLVQKIAQAGKSRDQASKITGTNRQYVSDAKKLKAKAPELFEKVKSGQKTLVEAKRQVREDFREQRRQENRRKVEATPAADVITAGAKFSTIVIDPPWDWGDEGDVNQLGRAKPDYATMSLDKLLDLPVPALADIDCHVYLWITNRSLPKGFALLERWGFRYVTALTWVKPTFGMGNYFRGQTEHVLFAVKGSQGLKRRDAGTVFFAERGKRHSEKPGAFLDLVESCSPGPYLEMFSRSERDGWTTWGEASVVAA